MANNSTVTVDATGNQIDKPIQAGAWQFLCYKFELVPNNSEDGDNRGKGIGQVVTNTNPTAVFKHVMDGMYFVRVSAIDQIGNVIGLGQSLSESFNVPPGADTTYLGMTPQPSVVTVS